MNQMIFLVVDGYIFKLYKKLQFQIKDNYYALGNSIYLFLNTKQVNTPSNPDYIGWVMSTNVNPMEIYMYDYVWYEKNFNHSMYWT